MLNSNVIYRQNVLGARVVSVVTVAPVAFARNEKKETLKRLLFKPMVRTRPA